MIGHIEENDRVVVKLESGQTWLWGRVVEEHPHFEKVTVACERTGKTATVNAYRCQLVVKATPFEQVKAAAIIQECLKVLPKPEKTEKPEIGFRHG
jgi:precorrin-4 methylase